MKNNIIASTLLSFLLPAFAMSVGCGSGSKVAEPVATITTNPTDATVFATPVNFTVSPRSHGVTIHFDRNTKAVSYKLYFGLTSSFDGLSDDYQSSPWSATGNNLKMSDLENDTTYYFAVSAVDASGKESAKTKTVSVAPVAVEGQD